MLGFPGNGYKVLGEDDEALAGQAVGQNLRPAVACGSHVCHLRPIGEALSLLPLRRVALEDERGGEFSE